MEPSPPELPPQDQFLFRGLTVRPMTLLMASASMRLWGTLFLKAANSMEGQESVHTHSIEGLQYLSVTWGTVVDYMTLCGVDLKLLITSVLKQEPWRYDSKVIPLPWRHEEEDTIKSKISSGGLTLGFFNYDGIVSSCFFLAGHSI